MLVSWLGRYMLARFESLQPTCFLAGEPIAPDVRAGSPNLISVKAFALRVNRRTGSSPYFRQNRCKSVRPGDRRRAPPLRGLEEKNSQNHQQRLQRVTKSRVRRYDVIRQRNRKKCHRHQPRSRNAPP
jgi:hypothetical protein